VAVYRYYCKHPACSYGTFTNLPPGLMPYSRWSLDAHLQALQEACDILQERHKFNMIPVSNHVIEAFFSGRLIEKINRYLTQPLSAGELADFRIDSHAGWWETSAMLLEYEPLVRNDYKNLYKSEEIGKLGYQGIPANASPEFAEAVINAMLDTAVEFLETYLGPLS